MSAEGPASWRGGAPLSQRGGQSFLAPAPASAPQYPPPQYQYQQQFQQQQSPQYAPAQRSPASTGHRRSSEDFGARPRKGSAASSVVSGGSASRLSGARRFAGGAPEEGDFVWVSDPSAVCMPALVVRSGFAYDGETEQEQQVTVVHTEEGEEREIRDQTLAKLPPCHHPKKLLPLELHDLSSVPLMTANVSVAAP
jgi:hypothetical protein